MRVVMGGMTSDMPAPKANKSTSNTQIEVCWLMRGSERVTAAIEPFVVALFHNERQ
jgi:hypothetical protein